MGDQQGRLVVPALFRGDGAALDGFLQRRGGTAPVIAAGFQRQLALQHPGGAGLQALGAFGQRQRRRVVAILERLHDQPAQPQELSVWAGHMALNSVLAAASSPRSRADWAASNRASGGKGPTGRGGTAARALTRLVGRFAVARG
ncbi:MAG: hypothetical protein WDN69_32475 [Aliidongia sp.]